MLVMLLYIEKEKKMNMEQINMIACKNLFDNLKVGFFITLLVVLITLLVRKLVKK